MQDQMEPCCCLQTEPNMMIIPGCPQCQFLTPSHSQSQCSGGGGGPSGSCGALLLFDVDDGPVPQSNKDSFIVSVYFTSPVKL